MTRRAWGGGLTVLAKNPGEGMRLKPVSLALDLGETFKTRSLDAYERLLMDTDKRQSHIVHAPRRARCGLALDRPHPGGMGAV